MTNRFRKMLPSVAIFAASILFAAGFNPNAVAEQVFSDKLVQEYKDGNKGKFMAGAHKRGCKTCHKEALVDDSERSINRACVDCHGNLAEVAEEVGSADPHINPHKSHLGEINCTACHAGHSPSVAYCVNCHEFKDLKISHNNGAKPPSQRDDWSKYASVRPAAVDKTDVLIIGSGASGFTAALSAQESGARVVIVEKMPIPGGNSQLAAGGMNAAGTAFQSKQNIQDNAQLMYDDTMKGGKNINDADLVRILAERSNESIQWLAERGALLDSPGRGGGASATRMHGPSGGAFVGPYLSAFFRQQIKDKNIDLRLNSKAIRLISDPSGNVTGAIIKGKHSGYYQIDAKAVILATGGFGANPEMVTAYRPELLQTPTSNQPGTQGDGIKLGEAAGAATVDMKEIQVNPTLLAGSPVIVSEIVRGTGAIFVNRDGERFISELTTRDATSAAIFKQKGASVFMIFDQQVRDRVKQTSAAFELKKAHEADTIGELANAIGIDRAALEKTVARYNGFVEAKADADFKRPDLPRKIDAPKYYAIEVKPAIHYTMGGLKFNTQGQVIGVNGRPIGGLYAAGEVTGGVHGANRLGGNSISETITFGRIAGKSAADLVKRRP